jgi:hypothetical protein
VARRASSAAPAIAPWIGVGARGQDGPGRGVGGGRLDPTGGVEDVGDGLPVGVRTQSGPVVVATVIAQADVRLPGPQCLVGAPERADLVGVRTREQRGRTVGGLGNDRTNPTSLVKDLVVICPLFTCETSSTRPHHVFPHGPLS